MPFHQSQNPLALGASLQNKLLVGIPGLKGIESLVVNSVNTGDQAVVDNSKKLVPIAPSILARLAVVSLRCSSY